MKKFIVFVLPLFLMFSCVNCNNKAKGEECPVEEDSLEIQALEDSTPEAVAEKIVEIYSFWGDEEVDITERYTTKDLRELIKKAEDATPEGELGPIDYDFWIDAQDYDNPQVEVVSVDMKSEEEAWAVVKIKDMGNEETQTIVMKLDEGEWKADDFITTDDGVTNSLKKNLEEF